MTNADRLIERLRNAKGYARRQSLAALIDVKPNQLEAVLAQCEGRALIAETPSGIVYEMGVELPEWCS